MKHMICLSSPGHITTFPACIALCFFPAFRPVVESLYQSAMAGKVRAAFLELSPKQDGLVLWSVFGGNNDGEPQQKPVGGI